MYTELEDRKVGNIFIYLVVFIGGGLGIVTSLYLVVSMFGMIGWKIYNMIKYHASLYD